MCHPDPSYRCECDLFASNGKTAFVSDSSIRRAPDFVINMERQERTRKARERSSGRFRGLPPRTDHGFAVRERSAGRWMSNET